MKKTNILLAQNFITMCEGNLRENILPVVVNNWNFWGFFSSTSVFSAMSEY